MLHNKSEVIFWAVVLVENGIPTLDANPYHQFAASLAGDSTVFLAAMLYT